MIAPEKQFPVGTRVRLKDDIDPSFYNGFGRVGNEGWIRKRKKDKYGYGQVFIEWDQNAWSYNGTENGWTHENHFEAVEESKMDKLTPQKNQKDLENKVKEIAENFVKTIFDTMVAPVDQIEAQTAEPDQEEQTDDPEKWENLVAQARESLADAPAYLVIALESMEIPGAPSVIIPRVFYGSRESEYALIVQSQLAHVLASLQDATIAGILDEQRTKDEEL